MTDPSAGTANAAAQASSALSSAGDLSEAGYSMAAGGGLFGGVKAVRSFFKSFFSRKGSAGAADDVASGVAGSNKTAGLRRQLEAHRDKLERYKADPDKYDNKGFLKGASPERRQKIIESRIRSLESQIQNSSSQIDRIENRQ